MQENQLFIGLKRRQKNKETRLSQSGKLLSVTYYREGHEAGGWEGVEEIRGWFEGEVFEQTANILQLFITTNLHLSP